MSQIKPSGIVSSVLNLFTAMHFQVITLKPAIFSAAQSELLRYLIDKYRFLQN